MSTEIDELKQARYRSDKTISGHNAFLRPPTGETNSVDTRGFYFVLKEPANNDFRRGNNYFLRSVRNSLIRRDLRSDGNNRFGYGNNYWRLGNSSWRTDNERRRCSNNRVRQRNGYLRHANDRGCCTNKHFRNGEDRVVYRLDR